MIVLPALLAAAVFANTLGNELVYDDKWTLRKLPPHSYITSLAFLRSGRGLTYAVHLLDQQLWDSWAPGFHLTNIVLHSLASGLAAYAAFLLTRSRRAAVLCGFLFAVHPVHVEVVASLSYRKDSLAMIFVLLALILWLGSRRPILRYAGSVFCLLLGLLSKEVAAVGLVPMLFLADLLPDPGRKGRRRKQFRRAALRFLPFVCLGILVTTWFAGDLTKYFTPQRIYHQTDGHARDYHEALATTAGSVPDVARLLFFPLALSADYPTCTQTSMARPRAIAGASLLFCWMIVAALAARRAPVLAFAMAWVVITYLPCSNIIPLTKFFVADRYLYVPSFGVCLLVALGFDWLFKFAGHRGRRGLRVGVGTLTGFMIVAFGTRSVLRGQDWQNAVSLWSSAVRAGFETYRVHEGLGVALTKQGRFDEAVREFREALRIQPLHARAHHYLGAALSKQGKIDEAIKELREALRVERPFPEAHNNLGIALSREGKLDEAVKEFREALRVKPLYAEAHDNLGCALCKQLKFEEAVKEFRRAVEIKPLWLKAQYDLGCALARHGDLDQAIEIRGWLTRQDGGSGLAAELAQVIELGKAASP